MSDFYPLTITEARYQGTYSGGQWVLIGGLADPRGGCDAFASDIPCMDFWQRVEKEGPVIEVDDPIRGGERDIVVMSGDSPGELFEQFEEEVRTWDEENDVRYDWPDIEETDFEDFEKTDNRLYNEEMEGDE